MFVGEVFRRAALARAKEGGTLRVLDLCAAPGGKTTDLAASLREALGDNFLLVANEVMRQRCSVLCENVSLWGDPNVVVTNCDPKAFASLGEYFDVIVADVPCSGEGMMRKDEQAVADWSPETVDLCAARQKRIVGDVWPALKPGGVMVYSTCTFEAAENDDNLDWICAELGAQPIEDGCDFEGVVKTRRGHLLVPGLVPGEGQWAGAVRKDGGFDELSHRSELSHRDRSLSLSKGDELSRLRPLKMGVNKGEKKGDILVPDADYALSLILGDEYPRVELDLSAALHFLHRDTIFLPDSPKGYLVVCYQGHPLGFVKNLGTRCNNLHPQGRRILKAIEI